MESLTGEGGVQERRDGCHLMLLMEDGGKHRGSVLFIEYPCA